MIRVIAWDSLVYDSFRPFKSLGHLFHTIYAGTRSNALDAIAEHGLNQPEYAPEITIRSEMLGSDHVRIGFIDNGPGMPETVRQRLFDPFFTTKEVGKGTGLGLSISYQIVVEKHQGRLDCRSALQQGTEFWIELPIQSAASLAESHAESIAARSVVLSAA